MASRPEHLGPPELFYNDVEANKYTYSSRIIDIQVQMCERAIELLMLPENKPCLLLDIGCGSGLSGSTLESKGHRWIGMDISSSMLNVAVDRNVEGDLILSDMGQGVPFRAATFDGAISISALQWLLNIDKHEHLLFKRLQAFFSTLFACLSKNARAVFQFYPENDEQVNTITRAAARAGFFGGTVVDYPNSKKAKKFFLVLMTSGSLGESRNLKEKAHIGIKNFRKRESKETGKQNLFKCKRNWILKKKERHRKQGKSVKIDSKYTGRKRKNTF